MSTTTASLPPAGISAISPTDAAHALWFFAGGPASLRPGGFEEHLLHAIAHADATAKAALQAAFPGPAAAVQLATHDPDGLCLLTAIAGGTR